MNILDFLSKPVFEAEDETGGGEVETPPADNTGEDDLITGGDNEEKSPDDLIAGDADDDAEDENTFDSTEIEFNEETFAEDFKDMIPEGFEPDAEGFKEFLDGFNKATTRGEMMQHALATFKGYLDDQAQSSADAWANTKAEWQKATREHPEFGGANLDKSLATAKSVAETYGGKEFLSLLKLTGAGNHPAMVSLLNNIAKELPDEPAPLKGDVPTTAGRSQADRIFSTQE